MKKILLLIRLTILVMTVVIISLQVSALDLPDTAAGKRGREVLELINSKSLSAPKEYIRQNCTGAFKSGMPENSWDTPIIQIMNTAGQVEAASIEKSEPYEIVYVIRSVSKGIHFRISISVEQQAPNKISMMRFMPGGQESNTQLQNTRNSSAGRSINNQIRECLAEQAKLGRFSGSTLIAKDGKPLLIESAGLANKRFKAPNRPDTRFNLGSLNKSFTAVAVLQLAEAGKIGIDDPIGKYLDFFPKDIAGKVTIRQLLTMSSGWGDYWGNPYYLQHKDELRKVSDYMEFIKDMPLDFEPGSKIQHSNTGYEVAGAIIERASGMDYFEYIREKIYKPAGMTDSDYFHRDGPVENLATGYTNYNSTDPIRVGWKWENTYILSPRGTPAGGGYSTVEDMLKYDNAFRKGRLISKDYMNFMMRGFRGKVGDPDIRHGILRSAGGAPGVSAFYARDSTNGYTIIVLTNVDNPAAIEIGNEIIKVLGLE